MENHYLAVRWDNNKDKPYTAYGPQLNPTEKEREGTEYWVISDKMFLDRIGGLEVFPDDCVKVWQCASMREAHDLSRLLCAVDKAEEEAGKTFWRFFWTALVLLIGGFGWFMYKLGTESV